LKTQPTVYASVKSTEKVKSTFQCKIILRSRNNANVCSMCFFVPLFYFCRFVDCLYEM